MAAAQEFSSPAAHMSSIGTHVVDAGVSNGTGPGESNIIFAPRNNDFDREEYGNMYGSSAYDFADRYNERYMRYNSNMFNAAKEYDSYMSNTAIQRQVEDLKAAGLNPILAANLGGATYHGVSAPYLSISPASALGSFLNYNSSIYNSNLTNATNKEIANIHTKSNELVSQFQECNKLLMQGRLFDHDSEIIELKKSADAYLDSLHTLNEADLMKLGFENDRALSAFKYEIDKSYNNYINFRTSNPNEAGAFVVNVVDKIGRLLPFTNGILR